MAQKRCKIAALTKGSDGAFITSAEQIYKIEPVKNLPVIDSTGAGDLFAAGFLYGISQGYELDRCGNLGSLAASEVISHIGARPIKSLKTLL
jgi:sugar/nucleoside kinase (ribokinase family)